MYLRESKRVHPIINPLLFDNEQRAVDPFSLPPLIQPGKQATMSDPADAKPNANGMISYTVYQQAFEEQREIYEDRYNEMQQCLTLEITRLTEVLKEVGGLNPPPAVAAAGTEGVVAVEEPQKSTPSKSKKRKAASDTTSTENKKPKKRIRKPAENKPSGHHLNWLKRYDELKAHHATHGDLLVTRTNNPKLYIWITTQRTEHRFLREGKPCKISPERIQMLTKLPGWQWTVVKNKSVDWDTRFQQLLDFMAEHGHPNVPQYYNEGPHGLGNFVMEQRRMHKAYTTGIGENKLAVDKTLERIAKLDAIGFVWSLRNRGGWRDDRHHDAGGDQQHQLAGYEYHSDNNPYAPHAGMI
jgi:hypothetical protein